VPLRVRDGGGMPITRRQFLGAGVAVGASFVLVWHLRGTHSLGVYNVQDYGAAGDGVANDTAEIQAALNAAADGDVVYFPPGTYMASGLTLSTDGVTLMGGQARRPNATPQPPCSPSPATGRPPPAFTVVANYATFAAADQTFLSIANGTTDTLIADCRFVNGGQGGIAISLVGAPVGTPIQRTTVRDC
jgi:polygalacturonase